VLPSLGADAALQARIAAQTPWRANADARAAVPLGDWVAVKAPKSPRPKPIRKSYRVMVLDRDGALVGHAGSMRPSC